MSFSQMLEILQDKDASKVILIKLGIFILQQEEMQYYYIKS